MGQDKFIDIIRGNNYCGLFYFQQKYVDANTTREQSKNKCDLSGKIHFLATYNVISIAPQLSPFESGYQCATFEALSIIHFPDFLSRAMRA